MASGSSEPKPERRIRDNYIDWDQYFMGVALISGERSKDPDTQVGACIVNQKRRIVGIGYNGMPDAAGGLEGNDEKFPWEKAPEFDKNKHLYVCHAEMNAIVNKMSVDIQGCTLYTTLFPCNECSKLIIQSGIKKIVYLEDKGFERKEYASSKFMLETAEIEFRQYKPKGEPESLFSALKKL